MNIPFILEKALSLYADKEAVVNGDKRFTYEEFAERVYRLSHFLRSEGVDKHDCVAILHQNSHEFLEAYFAAALLGAVLNPLNFRLSPRELALILKDSGASVLIASERFAQSVDSLMCMEKTVNQVVWTGLPGRLSSPFNAVHYEEVLKGAEAVAPPEPRISDNDLAHLYYTSGTTGRPKGVMLSHKNVCTHALAAIAELKLDDRDTWIHVAPLFHLADAWATFAITWVGGRHVTTGDFDPALILSTMAREGVTITNMIPTMLNELVNTQGAKTYDFSALRVVLSGGAPIAPELTRRIMQTFKCDYIQTYGMTETSPYLTLSILKEHLTRLSAEEQFVFKAKTGRPFMGVLLRVIREDGTEVSPDNKEVGEIIVRSEAMTIGYWNLPEETAKTIKDGWLYTGDMGKLDDQGYVFIVDRRHDMIISGGKNIYPSEIEELLNSHEAILESAVIGVPDEHWVESVKAIVVLKEGMEVSGKEIIAFCKEHLASYKKPKSVEFCKELPKSLQGKILKKAIHEGY